MIGMRKFLLKCLEWNDAHVKFGVYESPGGALNGYLTFVTDDVRFFVADAWNGDVDWNGKIPGAFADTESLIRTRRKHFRQGVHEGV